jgi:hypothetical protein
MILDGVALLLFLLPVPGWVATIILVTAARRRPAITSLSERATMAVLLSGAASAVAFLASARLAGRPIPPDTAALILIATCIAVSAPQLYWLWKFSRGEFGRGEAE